MPTLAEVFSAGTVDFRMVRIVALSTAMIRDELALAAFDEIAPHKSPEWNALSDKKLPDLLDWVVLEVDPAGVAGAQLADDDRYLEIGRAKAGTARSPARCASPTAPRSNAAWQG